MQLFMRNIDFSVTFDELKTALATHLHRPPFSVDSKINFHIQLFRQGRTHKGCGLLTLPTAEIGKAFLALYGSSGLVLKRRTVRFTVSNQAVNDGLVETMRTTPWEDPRVVREQQARRAEQSQSIPLADFSFGRFGKDGVFSPEVVYHGSVACNLETRSIEVLCKSAPPDGIQASASSGFESFVASIARVLLSEFEAQPSRDTFSARFAAPRIVAFGTVSSLHRAFLQTDIPPTFLRTPWQSEEAKENADVWGAPPTRPERVSSLATADFLATSHTSQALCLTFSNHRDFNLFIGRSDHLNMPVSPVEKNIQVMERGIYREEKLSEVKALLETLDFDLAFQIDKAIWGGILEPEEVLSMTDSLRELQRATRDGEAGAIFHQFAMMLEVPGLDSAPRKKRNRRRSRKKQLEDVQPVDLRERLAEAVDVYKDQLHRRTRLKYTPAAGIYKSYHVILTPSTQILEGPLPDQSNAVLRRFKNHDCFLRVSFQDENRSPPRQDPSMWINELLEKRYKGPLNSGMTVAGRDYQFLGYSMSGLKEYSFIFMMPFMFEGVRMDAKGIRDQLGDFSTISYKPALLGARWSQAFSSSDPTIQLEPWQMVNVDDKQSLSGSLFTDGCSSHSTTLNKAIWKRLRRSHNMAQAPSAYQFRCGGSKGVIVHNPNLPDETLNFRPSQTKFQVSAAQIRTLDVAATSARPIPMYLNRPLITLLEHHGTPRQSFMALQDAAIENVQTMKDSLRKASQIFSQHGLGSSYRLPSLFDNLHRELHLEIGPWQDESFLRHDLVKTCLAFATMHVLREIKHRARIFVPGSYTLMGVSDEWDCLEEGEVYATVVDHRTGLNQAITGRIVITRSPQIHPGDIQFVLAVRRQELSHLTNVVVFSSKGQRSLPSMLGGGDLDGDIYNLILNETLYPPKELTAVPGEYKAPPTRETPHPCTVADVVDFVIDYIKSDLVGMIATLHLRIADLEGAGSEKCLKLAEYASYAVDFQKRGQPVNFKDLPAAPNRMHPDFLSGEGVNPAQAMGERYYVSLKVLGELYRNVPLEEARPDVAMLREQWTDGDLIQEMLSGCGLPALGLIGVEQIPDDELMDEMRENLDEYCEQLLLIAKTHTVSKRDNAHLTEAEMVSGTIQERYKDHRKRRDVIAAMNLQTQELTSAIRHEFQSAKYHKADDHEEGDDEDEDDEWDEWATLAVDEERRRDRFERSWAAWLAAEEALDEDPSAFGPSSFGLLALGTMLEVLKEAKKCV